MRAALILFVLAPALAHADSSVSVTLNPDGQSLATEYGLSTQDLIDRAQQGIEDLYQTEHIGQLLTALANTAAFSNRGLGADYQADSGTWMVGVGATGVLASDVSLGASSHFVYGAVVNVGGIVGTSLERWGAPRWWVYGSGSYEATTIRSLNGSLLTGGAHVQYKLVEPTAPATLRWTGIDVTSGIEIARWDIGKASTPIHTHFSVHGTQPDQVKTVDIDADGMFSVSADTYTFPVELTTGVRVGALALYGGGGLDFTTGSSQIGANLSGPLSIDKGTVIGSATITASGKSGPDTVSAHALAGIELHTRYFRMFLQGTLAPADEAVTFGFRVAI
jgi:hypothetical protein